MRSDVGIGSALTRRQLVRIAGALTLASVMPEVALADPGTAVPTGDQLLSDTQAQTYGMLARSVARSTENDVDTDVAWRLEAFRGWFAEAGESDREWASGVLTWVDQFAVSDGNRPPTCLTWMRRSFVDTSAQVRQQIAAAIDLATGAAFLGREGSRIALPVAV